MFKLYNNYTGKLCFGQYHRCESQVEEGYITRLYWIMEPVSKLRFASKEYAFAEVETQLYLHYSP